MTKRDAAGYPIESLTASLLPVRSRELLSRFGTVEGVESCEDFAAAAPPSSSGLSFAILRMQQEHRLTGFGRITPGSWQYSFELNGEPVNAEAPAVESSGVHTRDDAASDSMQILAN